MHPLNLELQLEACGGMSVNCSVMNIVQLDCHDYGVEIM